MKFATLGFAIILVLGLATADITLDGSTTASCNKLVYTNLESDGSDIEIKLTKGHKCETATANVKILMSEKTWFIKVGKYDEDKQASQVAWTQNTVIGDTLGQMMTTNTLQRQIRSGALRSKKGVKVFGNKDYNIYL